MYLQAAARNERIKNKARDLKDMVEKDVERLSKVKQLNCFIFAMLHKKMRTSRKTVMSFFLGYRKMLVAQRGHLKALALLFYAYMSQMICNVICLLEIKQIILQ